MRKVHAVVLAAVAGGTLLLPATAASAATTKPAPDGKPAPSSRLAPPRARTAPKGYTVVESPGYGSSSGFENEGGVSCPGHEQASDGGVVVESDAVTVSVASSFPTSYGWAAYVNNNSGSDTEFFVYAICLARSSHRQVVSSYVSVSGGSTASWTAQCPAGDKVTGGGAFDISYDTETNLSSSYPTTLMTPDDAWGVTVSNGDTSAAAVYVYAVCRPRPAGYSIQYGQPVNLSPDSDTEVFSSSCPGSRVVLGGGVITDDSSADTAVALNSVFPTENDTRWGGLVNNGETSVRESAAEAICAGT